MSDQTVHTAFELPALPYGLQDLEPHLGEETLKVHHGRHHAKYVENLNRLLAGQDLAGVSLEGVLRRASESNQTALFNNAAQTWNHAFFWESMSARSSVPMMANPPASFTPVPSLISVPRPAMLVAMVTAPGKPASATTCASRACCFAFSTLCGIFFCCSIRLSNSLTSTEVVPTRPLKQRKM